MSDRSGLRSRKSAASPTRRCWASPSTAACALSVGTKPSSSPSPGPIDDIRCTAMERNDHGEVERDLGAVVADELLGFAVDLAGVELGDDFDALLLEKRPSVADAIGLVKAPSSGVA